MLVLVLVESHVVGTFPHGQALCVPMANVPTRRGRGHGGEGPAPRSQWSLRAAWFTADLGGGVEMRGPEESLWPL
ncbi:hypothetical protein GCM10010425_79230 [Streptomyces spororaveus]|uniref:Secreted protein n=1 Tax=Streptomyces spororaveus TaxID=284039 RepID=A0ABQ3TPF9_9ACTN|nr:hypothetical protein Sspor_78570 [Streptomyces spororaveus]